jgi:hypothetical protein
MARDCAGDTWADFATTGCVTLTSDDADLVDVKATLDALTAQ